jgi:putative DNA-invertase from lambdoid prophage Rac
MSTTRVFGYCRVSTVDQDTANQVRELAAAGFAIESRRLVAEIVSGSVAAMQRTGFAKLVDRMEAGDTLVVTKLDRLGRNAMDVRQTVEALSAMGVKVKCLALGDTDLTSSAGKMIMQLIAAMAEFERDLLIERTLSGQARAKAQGKRFGRPPSLDETQAATAVEMLRSGQSVSAVARSLKTSRKTINRLTARTAACEHRSSGDA